MSLTLFTPPPFSVKPLLHVPASFFRKKNISDLLPSESIVPTLFQPFSFHPLTYNLLRIIVRRHHLQKGRHRHAAAMQKRNRHPCLSLHGRINQRQRYNGKRRHRNQYNGVDRLEVDPLKHVSFSGLDLTFGGGNESRGWRVDTFGCTGDGRLGDFVKEEQGTFIPRSMACLLGSERRSSQFPPWHYPCVEGFVR